MFSTEKPFEVHINSGGEKIADLRFPTDEELCERHRKMRPRRRNLGRGQSEFDIPNLVSVDAWLFDKVRVEKAEEFDEFEASRFLEKILRAEVMDASRNGEGYYVEMTVGGGHKVKHHLRMPTQKEAIEHRRATIRSTDGRYGATDIRMSIDHSGPLWDKLRIGVEGYAEESRVPLLHKDAALSEVLSLMEAESDEPDPER